MGVAETSAEGDASASNPTAVSSEPTSDVGDRGETAALPGDLSAEGRSPASHTKHPGRNTSGSTQDPLLELAQALEAGIDDCLEETRYVLREWVRHTISEAAGRTLVGEPGAQRNRVKKVMRAVGVRSSRTAELLLYLIGEPDVFHDYRALAPVVNPVKGVGTGGEPSLSTKNLIRVRLSDLRGRLRRLGLDKVIQNQNRRGYMVTAEDALRIRMLWNGADPSRS